MPEEHRHGAAALPGVHSSATRKPQVADKILDVSVRTRPGQLIKEAEVTVP